MTTNRFSSKKSPRKKGALLRKREAKRVQGRPSKRKVGTATPTSARGHKGLGCFKGPAKTPKGTSAAKVIMEGC